MNIRIPSDYVLARFETSASARGCVKHVLTLAPPGYINAQNRRADSYVSREEWLNPKKKVQELGAARKAKEMEQYSPIQIEIEPDSLEMLVRDLKSARLVHYT